MKISKQFATSILAASVISFLFLTFSTSASAKHFLRGHRRVIPTTVIVKSPVRLEPSSPSLLRENRLSLLFDYLKKHDHISSKKYARLTGLSATRALNELQDFASNPHIPMVYQVKSGIFVFSLKR